MSNYTPIEWFNLYASEVGQYLPKKQRADITAEIRSLLMDTLDDVAQKSGREPDESMAFEVLQSFGSPSKMAGNYLPKNYLVGPQIFAPFKLVTSIVLVITLALFLIGLAWSLGQYMGDGSTMLQILANAIPDLLRSLLQSFGCVVLVYAILERVLPEQTLSQQVTAWKKLSGIPFIKAFMANSGIFNQTEAWDPSSLRQRENVEPVDRTGAIVGSSFIIVMMVLFNLLPAYVGILSFSNTERWFLPLLAPTYTFYLPWWNIFWALGLGLQLTMLLMNRWTIATRWIDLGLRVMGIAIVVAMLTGPAVIGLNPEYLAVHGTNLELLPLSASRLVEILTIVYRVGLVANLIVNAIALITQTFRLLVRTFNQK
jgi:hypothetical protein